MDRRISDVPFHIRVFQTVSGSVFMAEMGPPSDPNIVRDRRGFVTGNWENKLIYEREKIILDNKFSAIDI